VVKQVVLAVVEEHLVAVLDLLALETKVDIHP
jgi:hypothetical protein